MNTKIRVKIGQIEVEYEGESEYLKDGLVTLLNDVAEVFSEHSETAKKIEEADAPANVVSMSDKNNLSTNTIATELDVSTGSDLVIAAASYLYFVQNKETFNRQEILNEMKSASTFYKSSYSGNLSQSIKRLVQAKRLNLVRKDVYALNQTELNKLKPQIAS